jgi:CheY-like chemotaxis protein
MSDPLEGDSRTILLVEDEEIVREVIGETLTASGFRVVAVTDASEALECLSSDQDFCLVLTDHSLPGLNGSELVHRIRVQHPALPVLVVSGYTLDPTLAARGIPSLNKPFMPDELMARIRELLPPSSQDSDE